MKSFSRQMMVLIVCSVLTLTLFNCGKPKEGKVIVTNQEFSIRHDSSSHSSNWVIDAKGKVKNVGEVDVKNVVVTGYCLSCQEAIISNTWFTSNIDKMPHQKATIAYLPVGAESDFNFTEVALMMTGQPPKTMPEKMECKILSFETVQN
jgi:hypothetical protein